MKNSHERDNALPHLDSRVSTVMQIIFALNRRQKIFPFSILFPSLIAPSLLPLSSMYHSPPAFNLATVLLLYILLLSVYSKS